MKTEYEVKVLNINVDNIIERLESLGAIKKGEYFQRRYVYNFNPKIEGQNEDIVKKYIKILELEDYDITSETVLKVFARYGLNLESYDVLKFEEG